MAPIQKILSLFIIVTMSHATATAQEKDLQWDNSVGVRAFEGPMETVLCSPDSSVAVLDKSLNRSLFSGKDAETVKVVQSFGSSKREKNKNGRSETYVQVQFPDREQPNTGWVPEELVRLKSDCAAADTMTAQVIMSATATTPTPVSWTFPTNSRPTVSYRSGMRKFGSSRDGGARLHAAADLYRKNGEPVVSVTSGTVIRDRYYFYLGTYAIEVKHTGGKVVRYGEVTGKSASGVKLGTVLKKGQTLGYVGTVNSGCCSPMLHFEMFAGTASGALTQSGNKYTRRKDLMDPTANLVAWEKSKFGTSY